MDKQRKKEKKPWAERSEFARFGAAAFEELWYLVKLNLLFLAACAPVVTIPMALTAALRVTSVLAGGERPRLFPAFRKAFLGEWKRSLTCGSAILLLTAFAGYGAYAYGAMLRANPIAALPLAFAAIIFAALSVMGVYFFSMLAMCELTVRDMLQNALILTVTAAKRSLLAFFSLLLCFGASAFFFPVTLPLAVFLLPALGLLAASFALYPGLRRCMRTEGGEETPQENE